MNRTPRVQERGSSPAPRERWMSINAPTRHRKASARTCTRQRDRAAHQVRKRSRTRTKINRNIRETTKKRDAERKKANDGDRLQRQNTTLLTSRNSHASFVLISSVCPPILRNAGKFRYRRLRLKRLQSIHYAAARQRKASTYLSIDILSTVFGISEESGHTMYHTIYLSFPVTIANNSALSVHVTGASFFAGRTLFLIKYCHLD